MTTRQRTIGIAILLPALSLVAALVLLRNKPEPPAPPPTETSAKQPLSPYETKQDNGGNVTVAVTPYIITIGKPVSFTVSVNTHSVPLEFDLPAISALTDNNGNSLGAATWDGTPPGGHHRNGTLTFSVPLSKQAKAITLVLTNIAGTATRTFTWEVALQ